MEPILKNPLFPLILKTWKFFTSFHDYLNLPNTFSQVSFYEFHQHITQTKFVTSFTAQLIQALVSKIKTPEKTKKHVTAFFIAKQNKFNFFEELAKISAYELGLTEVTLALVWRDLEAIPQDKPFQILTEKEKFIYLSTLTSLISTSQDFKKNYMEALKSEFAAALENAEKQKTPEIQKKFLTKINHSTVLGKDKKGNCYFYFTQIGDSIFKCESKKKVWTRIQGQKNIKKEILDKIIQNSDSIENEELDLLEQVYDLWDRFSWNFNYTAFEKHKKLFQINQEAPKFNKLKIISEKLHELDYEYTKFISDCFNFRWATKERRIAYHKEINDAQTMQDLLGCFGSFFNETKCSSYRKVNTLDSYDTRLETQDQKPDQFKSVFIRANYLYCKSVYSETSSSEINSKGLYPQIKTVLTESEKFKNLIFEYLFIFVESMLGIIKNLYPGCYRGRLKKIERLREEKKRQQRQSKRSKSSKLTKNGRKISNDHSSSEQHSDSQSETAEEKKENLNIGQGRRLREKVKINYKMINPNSLQKKLKAKATKKFAVPSRKQPRRNAKGYRKSKMVLDSDSEEDVDFSMSEDDSETSEQSGGLNLDKFKYQQTSPKVSLRRSQRTSSKSKERR